MNDQDEALMLWRYRFPTEQWGYELLDGMVDDGEDVAVTAAREAAEESGWEPVGEPEHLPSRRGIRGRRTTAMGGVPDDSRLGQLWTAQVQQDNGKAIKSGVRLWGCPTIAAKPSESAGAALANRTQHDALPE